MAQKESRSNKGQDAGSSELALSPWLKEHLLEKKPPVMRMKLSREITSRFPVVSRQAPLGESGSRLTRRIVDRPSLVQHMPEKLAFSTPLDMVRIGQPSSSPGWAALELLVSGRDSEQGPKSAPATSPFRYSPDIHAGMKNNQVASRPVTPKAGAPVNTPAHPVLPGQPPRQAKIIRGKIDEEVTAPPVQQKEKTVFSQKTGPEQPVFTPPAPDRAPVENTRQNAAHQEIPPPYTVQSEHHPDDMMAGKGGTGRGKAKNDAPGPASTGSTVRKDEMPVQHTKKPSTTGKPSATVSHNIKQADLPAVPEPENTSNKITEERDLTTSNKKIESDFRTGGPDLPGIKKNTGTDVSLQQKTALEPKAEAPGVEKDNITDSPGTSSRPASRQPLVMPVTGGKTGRSRETLRSAGDKQVSSKNRQISREASPSASIPPKVTTGQANGPKAKRQAEAATPPEIPQTTSRPATTRQSPETGQMNSPGAPGYELRNHNVVQEQKSAGGHTESPVARSGARPQDAVEIAKPPKSSYKASSAPASREQPPSGKEAPPGNISGGRVMDRKPLSTPSTGATAPDVPASFSQAKPGSHTVENGRSSGEKPIVAGISQKEATPHTAGNSRANQAAKDVSTPSGDTTSRSIEPEMRPASMQRRTGKNNTGGEYGSHRTTAPVSPERAGNRDFATSTRASSIPRQMLGEENPPEDAVKATSKPSAENIGDRKDTSGTINLPGQRLFTSKTTEGATPGREATPSVSRSSVHTALDLPVVKAGRPRTVENSMEKESPSRTPSGGTPSSSASAPRAVVVHSLPGFSSEGSVVGRPAENVASGAATGPATTPPANDNSPQQNVQSTAPDLKTLARDLYPFIRRMLIIEKERLPHL